MNPHRAANVALLEGRQIAAGHASRFGRLVRWQSQDWSFIIEYACDGVAKFLRGKLMGGT